MNESSLRQHLAAHPWVDRIALYDEVDSTNTLLKALGRSGAPCGSIVIARHQNAGRGRLGRSFLSPAGSGIYLSALIRPDAAPGQIMHLTCAAAVAMCDALEAATGLRHGIKWTNDLVVGKQKLGGILTELAISPKDGKVDFAVIGIGINCTQRQQDFDPSIRDIATSVALATGKEPDAAAIAAQMIRALHEMHLGLLSQKDEMIDRYRGDCITLGQQVQVIQADCVRLATAVDIDSEGGLIVKEEDGALSTVTSGEVSVRGMYGYI